MIPFIFTGQLVLTEYKRSMGFIKNSIIVNYFDPHSKRMSTFTSGTITLNQTVLKRRPSATSSV